nr:carbohydrate-binding domain-containing protein [Oscillospiraceae bacterium]
MNKKRSGLRLLRLSSVLTAAAAAAVCGTAISAAAAASGDINRDGKVNSSDASSLLSYLLKETSTLPDWRAGDMDGDGRLDAVDLALLKRQIIKAASQIEVPDEPQYIHLKDSGISYEGTSISVQGKTAVISTSGTYYIDGSIKDGQVLVQIPDETADPGTVKLFFNGVQMTNGSAPCILVENAENTSVNLVEGKENTLSDGKEAPSAEVEPEFAVLHAKDDLTVKGDGALTISAGIAYGIHCNNDLKLNGGSLKVNTENGDAIRGRSSVKVKDGKISIDTEGDGIKSTKGTLDIEGGTVEIKSGKDALQSEAEMTLTGGTVLACGDRGLTAGTTATVDGCKLLATGTDQATEHLAKTAGTMQVSFVKEWKKNNPIALTSGGKTVFDMNTYRKFRYAVISDPALASGSCKLYTGGIEVVSGSRDTFSGNAEYTEVNNAEKPDLLYKGLFDNSSIHKIEVKMSNWNDFMRDAQNEVWYPCDLIIDGESFSNCAMRTKGNSSKMFMGQSGGQKYSFRFRLDKYEKYQNYHGLTEFCMNNFYSDPSCMRDRLCYDALHAIEGVGPQCAYTDMYLNGSLFSFYALIEQPGDTLAERYGYDDDTVLYKATERAGNAGGGMWGMGGNDSYCSFTEKMQLDLFDVKFGEDEGFKHIAELQRAINSVSNGNMKSLESIMDIPSFLKGFAVNSVMCNYDSYNGTLAHNYYLIYTKGKFYFVGWDYNLSMGNFMDGMSSANSDVRTSLSSNDLLQYRPLCKIVQSSEYSSEYLKYVRQIRSLFSNPEQYVKSIADKIGSHVQADPNNMSDYQSFLNNTSKSNGGGQQQPGGGGWPGGGG